MEDNMNSPLESVLLGEKNSPPPETDTTSPLNDFHSNEDFAKDQISSQNKKTPTENKNKVLDDNDIKYASLESTTCFSFQNLVKKVKNNVRNRFPGKKEEEFREIMFKALSAFELNGQKFEYDFSLNHLGGERWFVKCPKCKNPCLKLFLPSKYKDREQKYLCKNCHKLKNASILLGSTKRYKKVVKPLKRLEWLRNQLLKKSMTPEKAKPFLDEYEHIEKELASSPEYRLFKFQKEHGAIL